jgi:hypothetical protein
MLSPLFASVTVYSNLAPLNDTGVSLVFSNSLTVAGDQIQFSQPSSFLEIASIGTYNSTVNDIVSDATLRIYGVDLSDPFNPVLGSILGTFSLLNQTFTSGEVQLINFTLNGLPVGLNAIWTLSFSNPTGLGLNNFSNDAPTIGFSSTESYWAGSDPLSPDYVFIGGGTDNNFQAEFSATAVPEPSTIALAALALGALFLRRRAMNLLPLVILAASPTFAATKAEIPANDWAQIRAEYERHRHQITNNQAHSPYQGWNTTFSPTGFLVTPKEGNWTWGLNLKSYGLADQIQPISAPTQTTTNKNQLRHQHGNLTHWFINAPSGLEEGWTIQSRPTGTAKELLVTLAVQGSLAARADSNGARFLNSTQQTILNYSGLKAWDATGKALAATMTTQGNEIQISVNQQDAQYPITIDPTAQQAYLKASNTDQDDKFGFSVAISGDTIVVGAIAENNSPGSVGAAYVFTRSAGAWSQQAYLKASNSGGNDNFGWSVAISGDTVVVGAVGEESNATGVNGVPSNNDAPGSGAAYIFTRSAGVWSQQAFLKASNTGATDQFGISVAVSGDTVVVGAQREDSNATGVNGDQANDNANNSGAAYVFTRSAGVWAQQAYLKASNTGADLFGFSVAISGDSIVVGAYQEASNATGVNGDQANDFSSGSGAAYVFTRSSGTWTQQAYLKASNTGDGHQFGYSVGISGDTIVVGAIGESFNSGAAYVFNRSAGVWAQQAYLKASNTENFDRFGCSVGISGDSIVVGAFEEDSNATSVNGDQANNSAFNSGAAYVFTRSAGVWAQQAYLKASNTGISDSFGYSVAISGDSVVVGANLEDSNATGVNGDQANSNADASGAAYVFLITPDPTNVTISSTPTNLLFSSTGTGCAPGANLATPQILAWTPASSCTVTFGTPQSGGPGTQYVFSQWENSSTNAARTITAPASATTYTATFNTQYLLTITANPPAGGSVTPASATFFNANSVQPVTATPSGCYAFNNFTGATVTSGNVSMTAPVNLTANFTLPTSTSTTKGPVLTVRGTPNRFRQSISVTNTTANTADISVALSSFGNGVSIVSTPTGTSTTCLPPAASPYFTVTNVPAGQARTVTIDFNAPNAAALTYNATAITGAGPR